MIHFKRLFFLGSILLTTGLLFAFTPLASTAFAATTTAQRISHAEASTMAHSASIVHAPGASCSDGCPINGCPPAQSENNGGNNTSWVEVIQFSLNALRAQNFISFPGPLQIDGDFRGGTRTAVVAFQFFAGIGSSGGGVVGNRTWSALGFCQGYGSAVQGFAGSTFTNCPPSQSINGSGNDPVLVMAIQDLLNINNSEGWFPSNSPESFAPFLGSDGSFGSKTRAAVVNYQFAVGLGSSGGGVVGQRTWSELGMCF